MIETFVSLHRRVQVKLYEVLRPLASTPSAAAATGTDDEDEDGLRLIHRRRISALGRSGWEVFKVRHVVQRWVSDPSKNRGLSLALHTCCYFRRPNSVY